MGILDTVQQIEKRLEKLAARADVALEPIEIRKAALDEIEDLVAPAGRSRRVFPYNRVTIEVLGTDPARRASLQAVLGEASDLKAAATERLRQAGCAEPRDLGVRLKVVRRAGPDWQTGRVFRVLCERVEAAGPEPGRQPQAVVHAQLVVLKGQTTRKAYAMSGERTNIGRLAEVLDKDKRVVRRNQVVFTESDDAANQTVSRAHAHLTVSGSGEYRLFDDRSSYGTRIFRDGRTIALPSGSPRGTRLRTGDEIYFGQACVRFEVKE